MTVWEPPEPDTLPTLLLPPVLSPALNTRGSDLQTTHGAPRRQHGVNLASNLPNFRSRIALFANDRLKKKNLNFSKSNSMCCVLGELYIILQTVAMGERRKGRLQAGACLLLLCGPGSLGLVRSFVGSVAGNGQVHEVLEVKATLG